LPPAISSRSSPPTFPATTKSGEKFEFASPIYDYSCIDSESPDAAGLVSRAPLWAGELLVGLSGSLLPWAVLHCLTGPNVRNSIIRFIMKYTFILYVYLVS
jgi:hypothetical protein